MHINYLKAKLLCNYRVNVMLMVPLVNIQDKGLYAWPQATWHKGKRKAAAGNNANRSKVSQSVIPNSTTQKASNAKLLPTSSIRCLPRDVLSDSAWHDNCQNVNYLLHDDKFQFQFMPDGISLGEYNRYRHVQIRLSNGIHFTKIYDLHSRSEVKKNW